MTARILTETTERHERIRTNVTIKNDSATVTIEFVMPPKGTDTITFFQHALTGWDFSYRTHHGNTDWKHDLAPLIRLAQATLALELSKR